MSLAADRLAFKQALDTVAWVTAFQYPPNGGYASGDAWPLVSRINYPDKFGGLVAWEIFIVLHADVATSEQLLDAHMPALRAAVAPLMTVTSVEPRLLQFESGSALAVVVIAGTREETA